MYYVFLCIPLYSHVFPCIVHEVPTNFFSSGSKGKIAADQHLDQHFPLLEFRKLCLSEAKNKGSASQIANENTSINNFIGRQRQLYTSY